jgi:hypothetical protein
MTREELNILIAATEILHALKRQLRENREELCYLTEARLQNATAELHQIIRSSAPHCDLEDQ